MLLFILGLGLGLALGFGVAMLIVDMREENDWHKGFENGVWTCERLRELE